VRSSAGHLSINFNEPLKENYILVLYEVYDSLIEINQFGETLLDY